MSEITINKNNKSITFTHNNIAFSQFGIAVEILDLITDLENQLQQKENIIKEAKEFIYENAYDTERKNCIDDLWGEIPKLLEILDKGNDNEEDK